MSIDESKHKEALHSLAPFLGTWKGSGTVYEDGKGTPMTASETFETLEGGFFVVHRWHWKFGRHSFGGLEMLGYDEEKRAYFSTMYDNAGHRVTFELHHEGPTWHYAGEKQRAELKVESGAITVRWEHSPDGRAWKPLCEAHFERARPRRAMGFHGRDEAAD